MLKYAMLFPAWNANKNEWMTLKDIQTGREWVKSSGKTKNTHKKCKIVCYLWDSLRIRNIIEVCIYRTCKRKS